MSLFNKHEVRIFAMQRSGHHGIIEWLLPHYQGSVYFRNNLLIAKSPQRFAYYNTPKELIAQDQRGNLCAKDCFMFNVEEADLPNWSRNLAKCSEIPWGESKKVFNVLILRDALNLFASRFKKMENDQVQHTQSRWIGDAVVQKWIDHAREFLGETNYLPGAIKINYNKWCVDQQYRKDLAKQFDLEFTDKGFNKMSHFGEGSSFDKLAYVNKASQMGVLQRWKQYAKNKAYLDFLCRNPQLELLTTKVFGKL